MRVLKLFEMQEHLTSYARSITKIILSIFIVLVCIFRRKLFYISEGWLSVSIAIISLTLVIPSILILYISICELICTYSNRKHRAASVEDAVFVSVEDIVAIADRDWIVEIEILSQKGILKIGSSADNVYSEEKFFDKKFYVGACEFDSAEEFAEELTFISRDGSLPVLTIDGVPANRHFKARKGDV